MNPKHIVIVDDDTDLLNLLTATFESRGCTVHGFTTGEAALAYLLQETHRITLSLIVLDRMLPDMDGLEILKRLRKQPPPHIPVLMLSVLSAEKDVIDGLKQGAVDYMTKPFSLIIFMHKAETLMQ